MKNIFKSSDEEKNRIRSLHLTESTNKKISSVLSEQLLNQETSWFRDDCMEWEVQPGYQHGGSQRGFWTGEEKEIAVCTVGENKGKHIDSRLCRDNSGKYITAVYLGISCEACCGDIQNHLGIDDGIIVDVEFDYDFPQRYYDCIGEMRISDFNKKLGTGRLLPKELMIPGKDYIMYCLNEPYAGVPITNQNYIVDDLRIGITAEVCCGEQSLGGEGEEEYIDIEIDKDTQRKRKGCTWRPEPTNEPTLGPNGYSINNIRICHEGENVKLIQQVLLEEGYDLGKSGPNGDGADGKFGKKTKKAVQDYQRKYDLPISCDPSCDGIVGDETWKHMFEGEIAGEDPIITPELDLDIEDEDIEPFTDDELENFIEDNLEDKTKRKNCRESIIAISKMIKQSNSESQIIKDLIDNEELKTTLGYCFDERNYPGIMGHARRVKKAFGLRGKGNN